MSLQPRNSLSCLALASLVALASLGVPAPAMAREYPVFINIDDQEDLQNLYYNEEAIDEDTFFDLSDLLATGVNLNRATRDDLYSLPNLSYEEVDRILAYRDEAGWIADPAVLVPLKILSQRKLEAVAAFLRMGAANPPPGAIHGEARYQTVVVPTEHPIAPYDVPPMMLRARIKTLRNLDIGMAAILNRRLPGRPQYDGELSAAPPAARVQLPPKVYAMWDTKRWGIIAGSYTMGFGQRLTFDTSGRYNPNGFYRDNVITRGTDLSSLCRETPCDAVEEAYGHRYAYGAPDYSSITRMQGTAASLKRLELPQGWLQAHGFFAYNTPKLYQYSFYDNVECEDPRLDVDACKAPGVINQDTGAAYKYTSFPGMFHQPLGGGNLGYFYTRRVHVGVTGYGSTVDWKVDGATLDFKQNYKLPRGGSFGAVGADLAWGRAWADIAVEVAHSFDQKPSLIDSDAELTGGGLGAILVHTASWKTHQLEASLRYYDPAFDNPYARPIAGSDQFEGSRARDEIGGRLRYTDELAKKVLIRASADLWAEQNERLQISPDGELPEGKARLKHRSYLRSTIKATEWFMPGAWLQWNRDWGERGDRPEYGCGNDQLSDFYEDPEGVTVGCGGQEFRVRGRSTFKATDWLSFRVEYAHRWSDDANDGGGLGEAKDLERPQDAAGSDFAYCSDYPELEYCRVQEDKMRQDHTAWFKVTARPLTGLRNILNLRYEDENISTHFRGSQSFWVYLDNSYTFRGWLTARLRYDLRLHLDDRVSTNSDSSLRTPNPENWILMELQARF